MLEEDYMMSNSEVLDAQEKQLMDDEDQVVRMDKSHWKFDDYSAFVKIDRNHEDKLVVAFQKHGDVNVFKEIYYTRIPSLQIWARKYRYLMESQEDMFGELSLYFTKAVYKYKKDRGSFNTCLYTFFLNCIRNLRMGKLAKKRKSINSDPNSISNLTLSLDYNYNSKDGSASTLKDVIANELKNESDADKNIRLEETMNILSEYNPEIKGFLRQLSDGYSLSAVLKECKTKNGRLKISKLEAKRLNTKRRKNKIVSEIIKDKTDHNKGFQVVDYKVVNPNKLDYTIELKKTKESDLILKTIRKFRKDKNLLLSRIEG